MHIEQTPGTRVLLIEEDTKNLLTDSQRFSCGSSPAGGQSSEHIMAFGSAKENMHFLQHFGKFSMDLIIPILRFDQAGSLGEKTGTDFYHRVVLIAACLHQRLQNTTLIGNIKRDDRKNTSLTAHFVNL